ncbi:MAG: hypothetical protein RLN76_06310 [Phycisphaeraceae bacterium]
MPILQIMEQPIPATLPPSNHPAARLERQHFTQPRCSRCLSPNLVCDGTLERTTARVVRVHVCRVCGRRFVGVHE